MGKEEKTSNLPPDLLEKVCVVIMATGFCWNCGKVLKPQKPWIEDKHILGFKDYWCDEKCKNQYERRQDAKILKGKRAGYGLKGSCH